MSANKSGDSDELQALFESMSTAPAVAVANPTPASAIPVTTVAKAVVEAPVAVFAPPPAAPVAAIEEESDPAAASSAMATGSAENMFNSIGQLTREMHKALGDISASQALEKAASSIPDACDRLNYVATLTEQAANRTLNALDVVQPLQDKLEAGAEALATEWDRVFAGQTSVEEFKQIATRTQAYLKSVPVTVQASNQQLLEILMAQDFQDLTGQVIKKIVGMVKGIESGLIGFLIKFSPSTTLKPVEDTRVGDEALLNGPVPNTEGRTDVVANQAQVDDLLASLGF